MDNIILRKTLSLIWKILIIYSIYILLRGHNEPGGGFIGGLLLALAIILQGYMSKKENLEMKLGTVFPRLLGAILLLFFAIIILPGQAGNAILQGMWSSLWVPVAGKFSTVLLFDVAVYVVVAISAIYAHHVLRIGKNGGVL